MRLAQSALALLLTALLLPDAAHAFGKKRTPPPAEPADSQAYPTRVVSFGAFLSTPFMLPDGKTPVDMAVLLPTLVLSEMQSSQRKLRPRGLDLPSGENQDRYILRGGVVAFEANNFSAGIRIGYKPGVGDIGSGVLTGVEGKLELTVGTLEMVFYVIDTFRGNEVVASGRGSALPWGGSVKVTVDFGAIQTGADFVYRSPMAPHFRKAAREAILKMVNDPSTNFLMDWSAQVSGVNAEQKKIYFDAGARDDIVPGNLFTIYDSANMRLGEAKVQTTEHERSWVTFKDDSSGRLLGSVRPGDTVKIFYRELPR